MKFTFKLPISFATVTDRVDPEKGIIYGVSLITAGAAKGHKVLCDETSLKQILSLAQKFKNGLPIKYNIDTQDHNDGLGMNCGRMPASSIRLEDGKVIGDVHLQKKAPVFDYLIELAQTQPENFGLSIEASGKPEEHNGMLLARFNDLSAATFVDMPAANPTGLYSAKAEDSDPKIKSTEEENTMDPKMLEEMKNCMAEALKPISDRMQKLEDAAKNPPPKDEDKDLPSPAEVDGTPEEEKMAAGIDKADDMPVKQRKLKAFKQMMSRPLTGSEMVAFFRNAGGSQLAKGNPAGAKDENKDSDPIILYKKEVEKLIDSGVSEPAAIQAVNTKQPEVYSKFCAARDEAVKNKNYKPIRFGKQ